MNLLNQSFNYYLHALVEALGDLLVELKHTRTTNQTHPTYTQMFPVKLMCGHLWGLHITATTAICRGKAGSESIVEPPTGSPGAGSLSETGEERHQSGTRGASTALVTLWF